MLGWNISVFTQADGGSSPARNDSKEGTRLAVWQTGLSGLSWIDDLVNDGHAHNLGGIGYPNRYTAQAKYLIPRIAAGPPDAHAVWASSPEDILGPKWEGKTMIDRAVMNRCTADEWLVVVAWDES